MRTITAIMGDGIGPEVMESAMSVVDATGVKIIWERVYAGMTALQHEGTPLPQKTLASIAENCVALKGPCDTPIGGGYPSVNVELRRRFDLYANIRPVKSMTGVKSRYQGVNLVVFRENIEDVYCGEEEYSWPSAQGSQKPSGATVRGFITRKNSYRFFRKVCEYAHSHHRRKITIVHKANILKKTSGLFLETGYDTIGHEPSWIKVEDKIIDNMAMQLVLDPTRFDVIATTNLFGDILSDLCAGLIGGLGLAPGANIGNDCAIFEAVHGTAPDIAGKNLANPTALILSAAMMLEHIGEWIAAEKVRKAVEAVITRGEYVTNDISTGIGVSTARMTFEIMARLTDNKFAKV